MKLEQQVCSLDLAKRLKALNVKQESAFYWAHYVGYLDNKDLTILVSAKQRWGQDIQDYFAAFTVAELGELLPPLFGNMGFLEIRKFISGNWSVAYANEDDQIICGFSTSKSEADMRAKMLIYLIENGILKP